MSQPTRIQLDGQQFGRLLVIREVSRTHDGYCRRWACQCACGRLVVCRQPNILGGLSTGCGCARKEDLASRSVTHGETRNRKPSPEYYAWAGMRDRCTNPKKPSAFANYGGRGISVCERWSSFENFLADMGKRPSPFHSIDRINNNGNYEPANCRWATKIEQSNNRRPRRRKVTA